MKSTPKEKDSGFFIDKPFLLKALGYCVEEPSDYTSRFTMDELSIIIEQFK